MKKKISKKQKRKTYKKKSKGGNKLKIALVFFGQPRFVSGSSYESIKSNLLDKYECDTYAHLWLSNSKGFSFENNSNPNITKINKNIDDFKELYKPIDIIMEEPLNKDTIMNPLMSINAFNFIKDNNESYNNVYKNISRFTSQKRSFLLIKDTNKYDFIISIRTDLKINIMPDLNTLSKDKIYSPIRGNGPNKYIDQINIFPSKYAHYFFNIIDIFNDLYIKYSKTYLEMEAVMYHSFEYNNILQHCEDLPIEQFNATILRD